MQLFPAFKDTLLGTAWEITEGQRSCEEVLLKCLQQIDQREADVQAWVLLDREGALETAKERDRELAEGKHRGPLHGIPLGIKDIVDVAGWPTAAGSQLKANDIAETDAPVVARLREAGAVILGKTVTTQFASFDPPRTRNPWNLDRTPGGSSSGSAAAVAAGMCLGAVGSQTGGSITRPAAFCGVAGMKPTYGGLPLEGIVPLSAPMDHPGPLAPTVRDTAVLYAVMAGFSENAGGFPADWNLICEQTEFPEPKLGALGGLFQEAADAEMLQTLLHALEHWINGGAFMEPISLPVEFEKVPPMHRLIMARGAANYHRERFAKYPEDYQPAIRGLIEEGLKVSDADWQAALEFQKSSRAMILPLFEEVDVLISPASVGPAPDRSTTGNPVMNSPWSLCGFPTLTFPMALSQDGLPMGVQLIGKPGEELNLYRTALWCEHLVHPENRP
ncbi:MAG: amidase [Planctomycetaceae bacterium]|nr:amidase [Planctomycetaceae bacterium]